MAIQIPSGYIQVCDYRIDSVADRYSKEGKILKSAFSMGPSDAVVSNGRVIVDYTAPSESLPEDEKTKEDSKENDKADNELDSKSTQKQPATEPGKESYNYSILESYMNFHTFYEANEDNSANQSGEPSNKDNEPSQDKPKLNTSDEKIFNPGKDLYIQIYLPKEGCTVWHIRLDKRANESKVINAINSKKFKQALAIASQGLNTAGLVPLSATTYINSKAEANAPFVGHCRYAMDSGIEGSTEEDDTVCMAMAPIDARTNKPNENTVFKTMYNIIDDISNGEIDKIKDNNKEDSEDSASESGSSDKVSKWLNSKFKCVGDQSMYDNFLKLREFISKQISEKHLEYDAEASDNVKTYKNIPDIKNGLIYY